jgi:hypothetical protein
MISIDISTSEPLVSGCLISAEPQQEQTITTSPDAQPAFVVFDIHAGRAHVMSKPDLSAIQLQEAPDIAPVEEAIEESRGMLALPDNWDDAGAKAVSSDTWERVTDVVRDTAALYEAQSGKVIAAPHISHGPGDGSIDVMWRVGDREVLINFPPDPNELSNYYGDTNREAGETIKGNFKQHTLPVWILVWLAH